MQVFKKCRYLILYFWILSHKTKVKKTKFCLLQPILGCKIKHLRKFFDKTILRPLFPTAPTISAVGKEPHLSSFFFFYFFRGPLLDWFGQIMLYSHWSTQTWRSTNAGGPATDKAVVCTLIEPSNWAMPHSDFLAWLSSAALKIFISGVSSQIPLIQEIEPSKAGP